MTDTVSGFKRPALVVLSGGQDSATTLALAKHETHVRAAVTFKYGQRHEEEAHYAVWWAQYFNVEHHVIDVPSIAIVNHSALLQAGDVNAEHPNHTNLPATFVPGRNLLFLTLAAALAIRLGATDLWTGVSQEDYAGYPDCRANTLTTLEAALQLGMDRPDLRIVTPLMRRSKADTWRVADALGILPAIKHHTLTCYEGDETMHEWGMGCGECNACRLRANGWRMYNQERKGTPA